MLGIKVPFSRNNSPASHTPKNKMVNTLCGKEDFVQRKLNTEIETQKEEEEEEEENGSFHNPKSNSKSGCPGCKSSLQTGITLQM